MKGCKFCDKSGLAIYPVRYGIAPETSKVPEPTGPFAQWITAVPVAPAKYVLRRLRASYLYCWNEADKAQPLKGYMVLPQGYLYEFDPRKPAPSAEEAKFNCGQAGHAAIAMCVTVPRAEQATKVWLGVSDTEWTAATIERHRDAAYRDKHMRVLDVQKWLATQNHQHAERIAQLDKQVADFYLTNRTKPASFDFAPWPWHPVDDQYAALCERTAALEGVKPAQSKALFLALPDPAGIAQELSFLMQYELQRFNSRPDWAREVTVNAAILGMKDAVEHSAELAELTAAESLKAQAYGNESGAMALENAIDYVRGTKLAQRHAERIERGYEVTAEGLKKVKDQAWGPYLGKYNEPARASFDKRYKEELGKFDQRMILPLAKAHAAWLKSSRTTHYFTCNFDTADLASGFDYESVLTRMIMGTEDKQPCSLLYQEWLAGDISDPKNHLLRALGINSDSLIKRLKEGVAGSLDLAALPWDSLMDSYKRLVEGAEKLFGQTMEQKAGADNLARLVMYIAGSGAAFLGRGLDKAAGKSWMTLVATLGVRIGKPIVVVDVVGTKKKFREQLLRNMLRLQSGAGGKPAYSENQIKKAVADEMRLLQIKGEVQEGTFKGRFLVVVEGAHLERMPAGLKPAERAKWAAKSIRTLEQYESSLAARFRSAVTSGIRLGAVMALIQVAGLSKAIGDEEKASGWEKSEKGWRMRAAGAALAATICDVTEKVLEKTPWGRTPLGRLLLMQPLANITWIGLAGRVFGGVAGAIVAVWDSVNAIEQIRQENYGLALLYGLSAGIGFFLAFAAVWALSGPFVILALFAFFALQVIIGLVVDNKLQEWLKRCVWGKFQSKRPENAFQTGREEMQELQQALG